MIEQDEKLNKLVDERALKIVREYLKSSAYTDRKLTDTPTDALQVVPRKYVTLNGESTARPTSSVIGQFYFDTDLGFPVWWDGTGFVDAQGNYV